MNLQEIVLLFTIILQQCVAKIIITIHLCHTGLCLKLSVLQVILEAYSITFMVFFKDFFGIFLTIPINFIFSSFKFQFSISKIGAKPTLVSNPISNVNTVYMTHTQVQHVLILTLCSTYNKCKMKKKKAKMT